MAGTTRFSTPASNKTLRLQSTATFPKIINGDGGYSGAPELQQEAQYPMSNLYLPDRYTPWVTPIGTTPSPLAVQFDLASGNVPVDYFGLFAIRHFGPPLNILYDVGYRTLAEGYGASFTSVVSGSIGAGLRDFGVAVTAPDAKYWQVLLTGLPAGGASFGGMFLGAISTDMNFIYAPGETEETIHTTIQTRTGAGHLVSTKVGDPRMLVIMPFRNVRDAERNKIDAVFGEQAGRDPSLWINHDEKARQVVLARDALTWSHQWSPPDTWSIDLELEVLG